MTAIDPVEYPLESAAQRDITDAVGAITERRAVIEQTKGMLMFVYGIDADQAFAILRMQSQQHNIKIGRAHV